MKSGLSRIEPDRRDYSLIHTFGAMAPDPKSLPSSFSIYDGRAIPNQEEPDTRFTPSLPPMPYGCTGETGAFESGIQDAVLYNPQDLYLNTPPGNQGGRDIRKMLQTLIDRGPMKADGTFGPKRVAYFNCYGSFGIDDFDAVRIALWINQWEKRGVYIGTFWYWGDQPMVPLPLPSFKMAEGTLHNYLCTGWNDDTLEVIPWLGEGVGDKGKFYITRPIFNALMRQPWTGAFTITQVESKTPVPVGYQAVIDHLIYFIHNLFRL